MKTIFLVKYCGGDFDDYYNAIVFATTNEVTAICYVTKFNNILNKWKEYYKKYEGHKGSLGYWIKDEFVEYSERWHTLREITKCYCEEIEVR